MRRPQFDHVAGDTFIVGTHSLALQRAHARAAVRGCRQTVRLDWRPRSFRSWLALWLVQDVR